MKRRLLVCILAAVIIVSAVAGCASGDKNGNPKLDPNNPVTITIWHYYNGAVLNAFEAVVTEFNETVGMEEGIIVEILGFGNPNDLESAVMSSAGHEIGSMPIPNIFASYADTAYAAQQMSLLADLDNYFTKSELDEYIDSYIEEGRIGKDGELMIFPVAKSTEVMLINETDWSPFADEYGLTYGDISTMEGLVRVSELYHGWSGGKAFFGRDSRANMFIISSMQFGQEILPVENGVVTINAREDIMRKIWDNYYIPFIKGYFTSYGRFSSDDAKVGDILAYVGSTASAAYFPSEVTIDSQTYPVDAAVLYAPLFEGGEPVVVQQGAGMVVTSDTPEVEYACTVFLKWFTDLPVNIGFASLSGYMPVKHEAMDYNLIVSTASEAGITLNAVTNETLKVAIEEINDRSRLYTGKAFDGGVAARSVLENHLQDKALEDRAAVLLLIEEGMSVSDAVAVYDNDDNFAAWYTDFLSELNKAVGN